MLVFRTLFYLKGQTHMKLCHSQSSPFVRKVKLAAHVLGFAGELELVETNTMDADDPIRSVNPLGKIPALEDGGTILYLDAKAGGGKLIPAAGAARFETLTRAALMDGIMDAAILVVYEGRMRPEDKYVESFVTYQREKIQRGLEVIVASSPQYRNGAMPDAGEIALACVLDYLDFRQQLNWRDHAANLQDWLGDFAAAVPGYRETLPPAS
jgi:glutathione S-transferase